MFFRSVRQGGQISPFLFLLVVELLSILVLNRVYINVFSIFQRELRITQLAHDTVLLLKDKHQVGPSINLINAFSKASGLYINTRKCEILSIIVVEDNHIVTFQKKTKQTVRYLGIDVTKDMISRYTLNFLPRLKKQKLF